MTLYDDYPYPPADLYTPEQARRLNTDFAPREDTWGVFFPGEKTPSRKRALSIGCGLYEAIAIAAQAPMLDVTAIDASEKVIEMARAKAGAEPIPNLHFHHLDFFKPSPVFAEPFDFITAAGVLHHVRDHNGFLRKMRRLITADGGCATVLVYGDIERSLIVPFCKIFETLGVQRDADGIAFVRHILDQLDFNHPVKRFYRKWRDSDAEIADMFLHTYFRQYAADDLIHLMDRHGFAFQGWLDDNVDFRRFDYGEYMPRLNVLPEPTRWRIGQILNHNDGRLVGLFRPEK